MLFTIKEDWTGFIYNHLRDKDDPYYRDGGFFPGTTELNEKTRNTTLKIIPVYANFLLVAKIAALSVNIDTLEPFPKGEEIPVYQKDYFYGNWSNGLPEKQNITVKFFVGDFNSETNSTQLSLDSQSKLIIRHKGAEDLEEIITRQRKKAASFLKARAKQLGLGQQVIDFFSEPDFTTAELQFIESGSTAIIDLVTNSSAAWLDIPVNLPGYPDGFTIRDQINFQFNLALNQPTQEDIDNAIAAVYAS